MKGIFFFFRRIRLHQLESEIESMNPTVLEQQSETVEEELKQNGSVLSKKKKGKTILQVRDDLDRNHIHHARLIFV